VKTFYFIRDGFAVVISAVSRHQAAQIVVQEFGRFPEDLLREDAGTLPVITLAEWRAMNGRTR
jgi:hypothetical protein